jgi:hypothetical protein
VYQKRPSRLVVHDTSNDTSKPSRELRRDRRSAQEAVVQAIRLAPVTVRVIVALLVSTMLLAAAAAFAGRSSMTKVPTAMSSECAQAYDGYAGATDPEEADFWAESWMTFGCESGGYWA